MSVGLVYCGFSGWQGIGRGVERGRRTRIFQPDSDDEEIGPIRRNDDDCFRKIHKAHNCAGLPAVANTCHCCRFLHDILIVVFFKLIQKRLRQIIDIISFVSEEHRCFRIFKENSLNGIRHIRVGVFVLKRFEMHM